MANGGDGHSNDSLSTLMAALFAFVSWFARFTINRYYDRKERAKEQEQIREEIRKCLEEDKRKHHHTKKHAETNED